MIRTKRAYDAAAAADGFRVLVDRLWPRGVSKDALRIDLWMKDLAPSPELRKWFAHDRARWGEFERRYRAELSGKKDALQTLLDYAANGDVTLVFAAKDEACNNAVVLKSYLEERLGG